MEGVAATQQYVSMRRIVGIFLIAVLGSVAAGCGGDEEPDGTATPSAGPPAATTAAAATPSPTGEPASLKFGGIPGRPDVLTDASGRAVYVFSGDEHGAVTCLGACAAEWPGVLTVGESVVEGGKDYDGGRQGLGDGRWQATFSGDPLYYYAGDTAPGQAKGVGKQAFGGTFYLVTKNYGKLSD